MVFAFKIAGRFGGSPPDGADAFRRHGVYLPNLQGNLAPLPCGDFRHGLKKISSKLRIFLGHFDTPLMNFSNAVF